MGGIFITFEGCEGSGKSTQSEKIYQWMIKSGYPVLLTHEPGGTRVSDKIRELLLTRDDDGLFLNIVPNAELLLYLASRAQHVEEIIMPALNAGKIVLCDRFADATIAYQGYGRKIDMSVLKSLHSFIAPNLIPDLTILLDIDPATGIERSKRIKKTYADQGELDRMESQSIKFHDSVRQGYLELAKAEPGRIHVYDASISLDDIFENILNRIKSCVDHHAVFRNNRPRES